LQTQPNLTTPEYLILSLHSILLTCVPRVRVQVKKNPMTTPHFHKSKLFILPRMHIRVNKKPHKTQILTRHALIRAWITSWIRVTSHILYIQRYCGELREPCAVYSYCHRLAKTALTLAWPYAWLFVCLLCVCALIQFLFAFCLVRAVYKSQYPKN
jgi:hypothetical protein